MADPAEDSVDVSVIVAVRNGAKTLAQCIESVLAQTGCIVELIIVDALSDDGTREIVDSYGVAIATSIREPDNGIYDAWNKALAVARGEWCAFLGADDYYMNGRSVETLLSCTSEASERPVFVYGGVLRTGGAEDYVVHPNPPDALGYLRGGSMLPHPGFLHDTHALREVGGFDASFQVAGDFDATWRLLDVGQARRCDAVVTVMRIGGVSSDWNFQRIRHLERFRVLRERVTLVVAILRTATPFLLELVGYSVEAVVFQLFSEQRAERTVIAMRRKLGRAPRLNRVSR